MPRRARDTTASLSYRNASRGGRRRGSDDGRRDEHVTPLPPCLSVTRVEADVVAGATTDAEKSTWHHYHPVYLRVTRVEADVAAVATTDAESSTLHHCHPVYLRVMRVEAD